MRRILRYAIPITNPEIDAISFQCFQSSMSITNSRETRILGRYICVPNPIYKTRHSAHHGRFVFFQVPTENIESSRHSTRVHVPGRLPHPPHQVSQRHSVLRNRAPSLRLVPFIITRFTLHPVISRFFICAR